MVYKYVHMVTRNSGAAEIPPRTYVYFWYNIENTQKIFVGSSVHHMGRFLAM